MVFQRPTPFPTMSIYDNVAAGLRVHGRLPGRELDGMVERSLRQAALWDEVKDRLARQRDGALGRAAAAALHRADHRAVAGRGPARRADRVARSPGHAADRGAALRAQAGVHDHHRDPQHAAGGPGVGHHDLLLPRHDGRVGHRPGRSSRRRGTSRPRPTSPGGSDDHHRHPRARSRASSRRPAPTLAPRPPAPTPGQRGAPAVDVRDFSFAYGSRQVLRNLTFEHRAQVGHRHHRPVGLRQVHVPPVDQPAQRPDPRRPPRRRHPGRRHVGVLAEHRPGGAAAAGRAWCSSGPNPFPKSVFDNVAYGPALNRLVPTPRSARPGGAVPAPGGAVGRGEGPARGVGGRACRADSSSGSASRARWATSPRCC